MSKACLYPLLVCLLGLALFSGCRPAATQASPSPTQTTMSPSVVVPPTPAPKALVLVNGTLIDGTGAEPVRQAVVVIQGNRIVAAGPQAEINIPAGSRLIDVQGGTILPGFINAHVHDAYYEDALEAWAQAGVTTVRDEGILGARSLETLMEFRNQEVSGPQYARLVSAGFMITVPRGYGGMYVDSPEDARQKVLDELDSGVDMIKLAMEDGYGSASSLPLLTNEELVSIVTTAHERGALVSGHVTESKFLQIIVDAGVDDAAHMPWDTIPEALFQQIIDEDIYVVPTLTVFEAYGALAGSSHNLGIFLEAGGKVALGNDYTRIPQNGFDHFDLGMPMHEITRMSEAGATPMQIIVAATLNAAHVCGLEDELGTLEADKIADVLVVNGDPLADLQALTDVQLVIHDGTVIRTQD